LSSLFVKKYKKSICPVDRAVCIKSFRIPFLQFLNVCAHNIFQ